VSNTVYRIPEQLGKIPIEGKTFFFDTNVWIFLFHPCPTPGDRRVERYSQLYKAILTNGGKVAIDLLVVAEYINVYLKSYYNSVFEGSKEYPNYKAFRCSDDYIEVATTVSDELYHIAKDAERLNTDFKTLDLDQTIDKFKGMSADFNDVSYWALCKLNNLILVSDDADCAFSDIDIVTANAKLKC